MEVGSPDAIRIRPFTPDDRQRVVDFFDQMGGETRAFFDRNSGNRKTAMRFFDNTAKHTCYFLAECRDKMVGYGFLWDMDTLLPWLGIAVHEDFKGKGLGKVLMQYMIDFAREQNKGGLLLTTHTANIRGQALYERSGFQWMGQHSSGEFLYLLRFPAEKDIVRLP